ncbi:hypothetical protein SAMN02745121_08049 [Nannocystis exedens]|uniref:Uncharacterized protein n=1 Tax=Nannocystis exedens TaxID=54 RepID=A0A1I2HPG8_9BACT|nr:hypothetical protein [Nannocystis exedens]PCC71967.1 hypothetical protein NAEX_05046 [Nannocystis exedens]SFF30616.1 hypothetical protein SAMN02745121_08049 [Nannocystis exedens]
MSAGTGTRSRCPRTSPATVPPGRCPTSPRSPSGPAISAAITSASAPDLGRHASHRKFGRGRVLLRRDGKTEIEFADGVRTLADSFLTFE